MKAITGATMIDGTGSQPVSDAVVLLEGSEIVSAGDAQAVKVPEGAKIIDATGMTLMPGLIDTHDHIASFSYEIASRWGITEPRSARHLRIASVLKQTLDTGYTAGAGRGRTGRGLPHGCGRRAGARPLAFKSAWASSRPQAAWLTA